MALMKPIIPKAKGAKEAANRQQPPIKMSVGVHNRFELQATSVEGSGGGFTQRIALWMTKATGMSTAHGALPQLRAATDPDAKGGEFYGPRFVNSGPPVRLPIMRRIGLDKAIARLWEVSERETGLKVEIPPA